MNCIVTAGPTCEPLDAVRRLTNFSTGRLGTELANFLVARGHHVLLLLGEAATYAGARHAQQVQTFSTTADLRLKLKSASAQPVDALFHAAAVSDFRFGRVFAPDAADRPVEIEAAQKISSRRGKLLVELLPTPKILAELRDWFPQTRIVGWKFEADGARAEALAAAKRQMAECRTDACVVNGPAYGAGFGLVQSRRVVHLADQARLFVALEKTI